jgi:uncharacterized repeat protein (TIGR01451 family)
VRKPDGLRPERSRAARVAAFAAAALVLGATIEAQVPGVMVPTGRQEYLVLGYEQHLYNMLRRIYDVYGAPLATNRMNSVVSVVASADDQLVTYDHWEDGLEADPWSTTPSLATTLVLGDNNPTNGRACDWMACPPGHPADRILRGDALTFASSQTCTGNAAVQCYVAIPRAAAAIRFDGGDRIVTSGGPLSIIHDQNPDSPYSGGSTEVLPKQAYAGASSYSIPVGEDLFAGPNTPYEFVQFAAIDMVAFEANTQVFINSPGAPTVSLTLQAGQHYTNCNGYAAGTFDCNQGAIDSVGGAAGAVTINAGTKISSTKPVAILLFTANTGNYATDFMPILPDLLHGNDYILPSPGDNPNVNTNRPLNIYAYNPDPVNALVVSTIDTNGPATVSLAANQTRDYSARTCAGACPTTYVPSDSSVRLTANRNFWGVAVHDHQGTSNDWGYAWLATTFLKSSYTVPYAPGVSDPVAAAAARATYDGRNDADCRQPPQPPGPGACDSINRAPVFVAAAQDGTYVKVDFNNDGVYDIIDRTSDDLPDNGQATDSTCGTDPYGLGFTNCLYLVNALQVLRVYDYTDYTNTGTRVVAIGGKPIAMSYGQDTDQATGSDDIQDTGYTVYPLTQRFLDPVHIAGKAVSPTVVPGGGGQAAFTLYLHSFIFQPLTNVVAMDFLPPGLTYVPGSTLITYPNLAQGNSDPTIVDGNALPNDSCPPNQSCLTWPLSPNSLGADQFLTIRFTVDVAAGAPAIFANEVETTADYSGRTYRARGATELVRTDVAVTKIESDDGAPEPGDVITYTLVVTNNSPSVTETNVRVTDAIPPGTTYLAGSASSVPPAAFGGVFSQAQNAVVWTAASLGPGATATLSFRVRINADLDVGTVIGNRATYQSTQTPSFSTNETSTTVVGPRLTSTKSIVGGVPPALHPLEIVTFEVQVRNSGVGTATNLRIGDALALTNATYVTGTLQYSVNGTAFAALTDAADADAGTLSGTTVQLLLASLPPSADVRFRFQARVNAATGGLAMNNQATISADQVGTADTNLVQVPIVGATTLNGILFLDSNGNGVRDAGEPGIPNVTVAVRDGSGPTQATQLVVTDANGNYSALVRAGTVNVDVDETDPDMPLQAILTTGNEPQNVTAPATGTVTATNIGYELPPLTIAKTADRAAVMPTQTLDYTVSVINNTTATQTGITLTDAVPTGTTYVPGSTQVQVTTPSVRSTEYHVATGDYPGTDYTLGLNQALQPDYFVIVRGSAGSGGTDDDISPDSNYAALTGDPFGTGGIATTAANQLSFTRQDSANDWVGVVTVVECLSDCDASGFRLLDVKRRSIQTASGVIASSATWTAATIGRLTLFGGPFGAGCDTGGTSPNNHQYCHVRLYPSGTNTINWVRPVNTNTSTNLTVMVVRWGTQWTVQRALVPNGGAGGPTLATVGSYNTANLTTPVPRASTWVWGTGYTNDDGVGTSAEGVVVTLGNGVAQNTTESTVAVGIYENGHAMNFDVYTMSHPSLAAGHTFKANGDSGSLTYDVAPVASALDGRRMAVSYNSDTGNGNNFPRSIFSARYTADTTIQLERRRSGDNFAAWVQGVDFSAIGTTLTVTCANTPATCYEPSTQSQIVSPLNTAITIAAGATLRVTYRVTVDANPPAGLDEIRNDVTVTTTQNPTSAGTILRTPLVRAAVDVEPNNAGYASAGTTISFTHTVANRGNEGDAYALTVIGERGWRVDLVDPDTGVVIASDTNSDGTWDAGTLQPSTGSLAPGASKEYQVRVWVPAGATGGIQDTVRLRATSGISPTVWDDAKNEVTVLSSTLGAVIVTPDNSGVVQAASYTAYAHRVINNTAFADTFDFRAPGVTTGTGVDSSQGWTNTIHWDTNGDGAYTPGTDLQILNTAQLPPGGSQLIFVVVNAPGGTASGTRDISHLTAWSRRDSSFFGAATDTSTVVTTPRHDLSGGGSRVVAPGDSAVFPGTVVNLGSAADRFELVVTASNLFGPGGDGLVHATQLWVDTNADGVPDTQVATDSDGDGTWDVPPPALWDGDGDGLPDVPVAAGGSFAYELRRPIALNQVIQRDFVTLTSRSVADPLTDPDNVTATWIFAAVTRAGIQGLRVEPGELAFATSTQSGTASFTLYETDDPTGAAGREALHDQPIASPVSDSITPILYTVPTRPVEKPFIMIEEREGDGDVVWTGPFPAADARLRRSLERVERRLDEAGVPQGAARWLKGHRGPAGRAGSEGLAAHTSESAAAPPSRDGRTRPGVKIEVAQGGVVRVPAADIAAFGLPGAGPLLPLRLTQLGRPVDFAWERSPDGSLALSFVAQPLRTDYAAANTYLLTLGAASREPAVPLTRSAEPEVPGLRRVERSQLYVPSVPAGADPWQWDILFSGQPWPDPAYDPAAGTFDLRDLGHLPPGPAAVQLRVVGYTHHRHSVAASINGIPVGSVTFDGAVPSLLTGTVPAEALRAAGNQLTLDYQGTPLPGSPATDAFAYLDYVDVGVPVATLSRRASFTLSPWRPLLPNLQGVDYLVVTHPLFRAQADRIAAAKAGSGYHPAVVDTDTAYDRFSGGIVEPRSIQALVRFAARTSGTLRYVLLVGDDSFDPLDHSGRGVPSFVPSLFARDSGWGLVPSENLYADLDDDGAPDVAIGRLPVRTPEDADAVADKIAAQDAALADLGETHLAVADNTTESDAPFRDDAQEALSRLPDGATVQWADLALGPAAARAALLAGWQAGVMATHYFGHGGLTEWADEQVLTTEDVATLGSGWKPTALFTWACLSQYYLGVDGPSLNESLLLQAGGGALASFGPVGITPPARQAPLVARVYDELRSPGVSLGEAIRRAKAAVVAEQPSSREVVEGFHLFGDPALKLYQAPPVPR